MKTRIEDVSLAKRKKRKPKDQPTLEAIEDAREIIKQARISKKSLINAMQTKFLYSEIGLSVERLPAGQVRVIDKEGFELWSSESTRKGSWVWVPRKRKNNKKDKKDKVRHNNQNEYKKLKRVHEAETSPIILVNSPVVEQPTIIYSASFAPLFFKTTEVIQTVSLGPKELAQVNYQQKVEEIELSQVEQVKETELSQQEMDKFINDIFNI